VPLVDRNQIIQAFAPDRPDEPFAIRVRLGSEDRRSDRSHAKVLQGSIERRREDRIAIVNDEPVWMRIGENLPALLRGPFGGGMMGHIEVQNPPRADLHRDEDAEDLKLYGDRHQKIAGDDRLGLILDEGRPTLIATSTAGLVSIQVFSDRPG
jgi:hypothetical protein